MSIGQTSSQPLLFVNSPNSGEHSVSDSFGFTESKPSMSDNVDKEICQRHAQQNTTEHEKEDFSQIFKEVKLGEGDDRIKAILKNHSGNEEHVKIKENTINRAIKNDTNNTQLDLESHQSVSSHAVFDGKSHKEIDYKNSVFLQDDNSDPFFFESSISIEKELSLEQKQINYPSQYPSDGNSLLSGLSKKIQYLSDVVANANPNANKFFSTVNHAPVTPQMLSPQEALETQENSKFSAGVSVEIPTALPQSEINKFISNSVPLNHLSNDRIVRNQFQTTDKVAGKELPVSIPNLADNIDASSITSTGLSPSYFSGNRDSVRIDSVVTESGIEFNDVNQDGGDQVLASKMVLSDIEASNSVGSHVTESELAAPKSKTSSVLDDSNNERIITSTQMTATDTLLNKDRQNLTVNDINSRTSDSMHKIPNTRELINTHESLSASEKPAHHEKNLSSTDSSDLKMKDVLGNYVESKDSRVKANEPRFLNQPHLNSTDHNMQDTRGSGISDTRSEALVVKSPNVTFGDGNMIKMEGAGKDIAEEKLTVLADNKMEQQAKIPQSYSIQQESLQRAVASKTILSPHLSHVLANPQWSNAVADKVLSLAAQNIHSAEIQLDPPELGQLQIKMHVGQESASVNFISAHASVREALDASSSRLREMFQQEGLDLVDVDVSDQPKQRGAFDENSDDQATMSQDNDAHGPELDTELNEVKASVVKLKHWVDFYA
ncbi:MAG: flagellar hook-length control protein FliK [Cellvibrionaceae bacterium]